MLKKSEPLAFHCPAMLRHGARNLKR